MFLIKKIRFYYFVLLISCGVKGNPLPPLAEEEMGAAEAIKTSESKKNQNVGAPAKKKVNK